MMTIIMEMFKGVISGKGPWRLIGAVVLTVTAETVAAVVAYEIEKDPVFTLAVVALLFALFTLIGLMVWALTVRKERRMEGEAYVFLEVKPPKSPTVAQEMSKDPRVVYSAAVWGPWDFISRVTTANASELRDLVKKMQQTFAHVQRTETYLILPEQLIGDLSHQLAANWLFCC